MPKVVPPKSGPTIVLQATPSSTEERVWYFTVSCFVLLSQLFQDAVGKLSIFIVGGVLVN